MDRKVVSKDRAKIALIDGLPLSVDSGFKVVSNNSIKYSWDSDFFGIPEYRMHGSKMLKAILKENLNAQIIVFPFYPKFNSVYKNYKILAENIEKAVDYNCGIICLCLEVLSVNYLSSEMLKAYKYAYENRVVICVSAGNNRPFKNPLIHKKYTIPILGFMRDEKFKNNYNKPNFRFISYNQIDLFLEMKSKKINCSLATALFCGWLSVKTNSLKGLSIIIYSELQDF